MTGSGLGRHTVLGISEHQSAERVVGLACCVMVKYVQLKYCLHLFFVGILLPRPGTQDFKCFVLSTDEGPRYDFIKIPSKSHFLIPGMD